MSCPSTKAAYSFFALKKDALPEIRDEYPQMKHEAEKIILVKVEKLHGERPRLPIVSKNLAASFCECAPVHIL